MWRWVRLVYWFVCGFFIYAIVYAQWIPFTIGFIVFVIILLTIQILGRIAKTK